MKFLINKSRGIQMDTPVPDMDPLEEALVDTLAHLLKDLDGNDVIPMTLGQFASISKTIKYEYLTVEGEVVIEVIREGGLCHIYFDDEGSRVTTIDGQIEVHTKHPLMVFVRLGELVTGSGIFNKSFPINSSFRNWPNTVADIQAQTTISNGSLGDGDYTLIPMAFGEFLALEKDMRDVNALMVRGTSIDSQDGIHGFALEPHKEIPNTWTAWSPYGQMTDIVPETGVKVISRYPAPIIKALSKLRKGE